MGLSRGVRCSSEQIIVTSGAQQALDLLARVLLDPGDEVWMEDPGYPGASQAFQSAGASVIPIPVDGDGIDVARAIKSSPAARVVYVTPANQFPLGTVMSAEDESNFSPGPRVRGHGLSKMNTTRNIAIPGSRLRHCTASIDLDRSFMLEHLRRCSSTLFALGSSLFRNG